MSRLELYSVQADGEGGGMKDPKKDDNKTHFASYQIIPLLPSRQRSGEEYSLVHWIITLEKKYEIFSTQ